MVDACHWLGSKQEGRKRGIIVKFTRQDVKEVLNSWKIKRNFNTYGLSLKILNAARALKKEKGYTFVWVKNGRIFLQKNEGNTVIVVTSTDRVAGL